MKRLVSLVGASAAYLAGQAYALGPPVIATSDITPEEVAAQVERCVDQEWSA